MLRKSIAGIFCLILAFCLFSMPVDADTYTPLEDFIHTIQQEEKTIILTKYTADGSEVRVPESYRLDGVQYSVILDSSSVFFENTNLRSVAIESGVAFKDDSMSRLFANCTQLRSVNINAVDTGTITDMSYLFYKCENFPDLKPALSQR